MALEKEINRCIDLVGRNHNEAWHNRDNILECMKEAEQRHKGLDWIKFKGRYLLAAKIAKQLPWEAEQVHEHLPQYEKYGIVPYYANGVNGDSQGWCEVFRMPDGSLQEVVHPGKPRGGERPAELETQVQEYLAQKRKAITDKGGVFTGLNRPSFFPQELSKDENSLEYKCAVLRNYWGGRMFSFASGTHPRTVGARTAWLRSNAGEYESYVRGRKITGEPTKWEYKDRDEECEIYKQDGGDGTTVWQVNYKKQVLLKIWKTYRCGYEIDNAVHAWPREGYEKRACLTWGSRPEVN